MTGKDGKRYDQGSLIKRLIAGRSSIKGFEVWKSCKDLKTEMEFVYEMCQNCVSRSGCVQEIVHVNSIFLKCTRCMLVVFSDVAPRHGHGHAHGVA